MYVVGSAPFIASLHKFISLTWKEIANPAIYYNEEEYVVVTFSTKEDYDIVVNFVPLNHGQYEIGLLL